MKIETDNVVEKLVSKALRIKDYEKIMTSFDTIDISSDDDFQKTFNRFYVVRRNKEWRQSYYSYFEENKNRREITFSEILFSIFSTTNQIEQSFSSKMLATINPNMPIWDTYVFEHLGFELGGNTKIEQLENRVELYDKIIFWYDNFLLTEDAEKLIKLFNGIMPHYTWLTPTKKIDYIIWGMRE